MELTFDRLDPSDQTHIAAFIQVRDAAREPSAGWRTTASRDHLIAKLQPDNPHMTTEIFLARHDDGHVVGCSQLALPTTKDRDMAWLAVYVSRDFQSRGIGSQLVDAAIPRLTAHKRTRILAEFTEPHGTTTSRSRTFAQRHGFRVCNVMVKMKLTWPRLPDVDAANSHVLDNLSGFEIRHYEENIPTQDADALAALNDRVVLDMPDTGLGWDTTKTTGQQYAEKFAYGVATGENPHVTTLWQDGKCAALTKMIIHGDWISQATTVVAPEFRGQQLGIAVKELALERMRARFPQILGAGTETSTANTHMIAVNNALGYVSVNQLAGLRRDL